MPFKSEAQRRYFHWAAGKGKISPKTVATWEEHTKGKNLPEKVKNAAFLDELEKIASEGQIPAALAPKLRFLAHFVDKLLGKKTSREIEEESSK